MLVVRLQISLQFLFCLLELPSYLFKTTNSFYITFNFIFRKVKINKITIRDLLLFLNDFIINIHSHTKEKSTRSPLVLSPLKQMTSHLMPFRNLHHLRYFLCAFFSGEFAARSEFAAGW